MPPPLPPPPPQQASEVRQVLTAMGLEGYAAVLIDDLGYDDLAYMHALLHDAPCNRYEPPLRRARRPFRGNLRRRGAPMWARDACQDVPAGALAPPPPV